MKQLVMFMDRLGISIDPEQLAILEVIARMERCSVEEIIIKAINKYVIEASHQI